MSIFNLCKEISDNLHPSTEQQAESNVPDLVQTISQSMEHGMVDIDEDAEESFFQIKEVYLCIILYRNIWRIYVNLCKLIWMY